MAQTKKSNNTNKKKIELAEGVEITVSTKSKNSLFLIVSFPFVVCCRVVLWAAIAARLIIYCTVLIVTCSVDSEIIISKIR